MKVDIYVIGHLTYVVAGLRKEYIALEIYEGTKLSDIADKLNIKKELILAFFVNREKKDMDYTLREGDKISIISPPAGG